MLPPAWRTFSLSNPVYPIRGYPLELLRDLRHRNIGLSLAMTLDFSSSD